MREIKYRAWDKEQSRWCDYFAITHEGEYLGWNSHIVAYDSIREGMEKRFDVQLYTGLKDKNGVEMYEGDIIEVKHWAGDTLWEHALGEVQYGKFETSGDNQGYGNDLVCGSYLTNFVIHADECNNIFESTSKMSPLTFDTCEVIGNIYENKELLNEK